MAAVSVTRSSRRPNRTHYAGDLRRELMDAALAVVAAEGPAAVNLRALARQLGVSHNAPSKHFTDKIALFTTIAREGFELLGAAMAGAAAVVPTGTSAVERLRAVGMAYMQFGLTHPAHFEVMWRSDLHDDDPGLRTAGQDTLDQLMTGVRAAQEQGWAADSRADTVAYVSWAAIHGLVVLWINGPLREHATDPFGEVAASVSALLRDSLGRPATIRNESE
jgi:AcrR family transcriptional regulator